MNKRSVGIAVAIIISVPVLWYLFSPLFLTKRVNESMDDLIRLSHPASSPAITNTAPMMDLSQVTPPPGKDPQTESKGPTAPPPSTQANGSDIRGVGQGTFEGLAGHSASGRASLLRIGETFYVRLEDDFRVTNGPDLVIGFGKNGTYDKTSMLAELKGNEGGQNYEVPDSVNAALYNEVWIYCRAFSVPFGKAVLN